MITLYLLPSMMINLRSKDTLRRRVPATRVVSHDYSFDDWHPDDQVGAGRAREGEGVNGVPKATLLLWIVPAKVAGRWQIEVDGGPRHELSAAARRIRA